jgi:large subunit ribosomal protein L23
MAKEILIRPIISEKSEILSEGLNQYSFVVNKAANKIEIRKAVEDTFGVAVASVNTITMPSKSKVRNTKSGIVRGSVSSYKKAVVSLVEGEQIDFFGDI